MEHIVEWEEVEPIARDIFDVFGDRREPRWAKVAWAHLKARKLTGAATCREKAQTYIRLLALASVYRDWWALVWELTCEDETDSWIPAFGPVLIGVGQLLGPDEVLSHDSAEAFDQAVETLIPLERPAVVNAVLSGFGDEGELLSSLWRSGRTNLSILRPQSDDVNADDAYRAPVPESDDEDDAEDDDPLLAGVPTLDEMDEDEYFEFIRDALRPGKLQAGFDWMFGGCEYLVAFRPRYRRS